MNAFSRMYSAVRKALTWDLSDPPSGLLASYREQAGSSPRPNENNVPATLNRYADQAWVYACVSIIQSKGAGVPLKVYRQVGDHYDEVPDHPIKRLLDSVNPFMNGYDLLESMWGYLDTVGNAFWLLDNIVGGKPTEIYPLNPAYVRVKVDPKTGPTGYEYRVNSTNVTFPPEQIVHLHYWNPWNEFWGMPPLSAGRDAADMLQSADRYNSAFFANSAEPGGVLSTDKPLQSDARTRIEEAWKKSHQGSRKAHRIAMLEGGLKWQPTSMSQKDMQFAELKRMSREDVLAVFRIPPVMVGVFDEANYSNAREQRRIFWMDCMLPRFRKVESVLNEFLVKPYDANVIVRFDTSEVEELQADAKLQAESDQINTASGILTINEVRSRRKLKAVPWGDTWNAPAGVYPIEDHGAPAVPGAGDPNPPDPSGEPPVPTGDNQGGKTDEGRTNKGVLRRSATWQRFKVQTETMERRWYPPLRKLFNGQEREVIANLRKHWEPTKRQAILNGVKAVKQDLSVILFERGEARKRFQKEGRRLIELALAEKAKEEINNYDLPEFQVLNPRTITWIETKAFKFANEINLTTENALRRELEEAVTAGEAISDVEKRIENVFDIARGPRTEMIARTEVISASNRGAVEAYEQSRVVEGIEWVSSRDGKVRDEHQIDGEAVPLGHSFSNGLKFPGDPEGEASLVINCRCTTAPVISKGKE